MEQRSEIIREAIKCIGTRRIPTRTSHARRNDFNCVPGVPGAQTVITDTLTTTKIGKREFKVYRDTHTGENWVRMPWWLSMFHNPARNLKFVSYDADIVPHAQSSSEFIVRKTSVTTSPIEGRKTIESANILSGSFNFRSRGFPHFLADVLPPLLYLKCVGA